MPIEPTATLDEVQPASIEQRGLLLWNQLRIPIGGHATSIIPFRVRCRLQLGWRWHGRRRRRARGIRRCRRGMWV